jgi:hypothetical protein
VEIIISWNDGRINCRTKNPAIRQQPSIAPFPPPDFKHLASAIPLFFRFRATCAIQTALPPFLP